MEYIELDIKLHPPEYVVETECQISPGAAIDLGQQSQSPEAPSIAHSDVFVDIENECTGPNIGYVDSSQKEYNDDYWDSNISFDHNFQIEYANGIFSQESDISPVDVSNMSSVIETEGEMSMVPKIGMEFDSEDHAYKWYSWYAVMNGFSIRKDFVNKSKVNGVVVSRRYTCYRQGYRSNKQNANVRKPVTRTGCLAYMTISRHPNGKFRVAHFETEHNHELATPCTAHMLPSQRRLSFAEAVESNVYNNSVWDGVPKLGMGFDSEDHAYEFYNTYAGQVGFSVRKDYVNKSKVDGTVVSRRFTCFREGFRQKDKRHLNVKWPRKETRIGCLAQLVISRQPDGKYCVTHFEKKHNHELVAACSVHMLRSQKRMATNQAIKGNAVDGSSVLSKSALNCKDIEGLDDWGCDPIEYGNELPIKRISEI